MFNKQMYDFGAEPSAIRTLFAHGMERKAAIGAENVFDFSIGNPSVPAPASVACAIQECAAGMEPADLHAYSAAQGHASCASAIADNLNRRYGTTYTEANFYLTAGAAAALACSIRALSYPGDEWIVFSPYFPEYATFIKNADCTIVPVLTDPETFQIDPVALEAAITPKTKGVIVNSPNNPVGTVYTPENLEAACAVLKRKSEERGEPIYLISDEPYRELVYSDVEVSWMPSLYENTIVCYSWSKSLSLPGERIGYVLVPDTMPDWKDVWTAVAGAGRSLGYICAPVLFQNVIMRCVDEMPDTESYRKNRAALTEMLDELGYHYVSPDGAFYLWMQALEPDAQAFSDKAKEHELMLVPSDSFGVPGWVRIGYCVSYDTIVNSREAFAALKKDYE